MRLRKLRFVGRAPLALVAFCLLAVNWLTAAATSPALSNAAFAALVEKLSEPGGEFGADNLISNEQSYLHVMPALERARVNGGAYVGVAPDQNFSYVAQIKPEIAYLIDLRRDNLLLLLLFKALFAEAPTRVGYLCLLTGRPPPEQPERWADKPIDALIAYVDGAAPLPEAAQKKIQERLETVMRGFGVPLSAADLATLAKARSEFVNGGLALQFEVRGQGPRDYYPTLRTLLAENDRAGHQLSFLANETAFQFVRSLQLRNLIVPVVGDVSGSQAMRGIAADMKARGLRLSGFYISNVEYYLFPDRTFARYIDNLKEFPRDERSMVIRSVFPSGGNRTLAPPVAGYYSTSLVQSLDVMLTDFAAGKYPSYRELVLASTR